MIIHVDLDAFFAAVEQRDNPKLRGKPVVVGGPPASYFSPPGTIHARLEGRLSEGGSLGIRGVVSTASYEARKFGIYSGMPLFKAVKLCPQAIFVPGNFAKYEEASDLLLQICSSYSPIIEQTSLDELYIDLAGTDMLYEPRRGAFGVAEQIQRRVKKEIGITCSLGISTQKTLAKIASGFKKPNRITEVEQGKEKEFLAPLPIKNLPGCGRQTQTFLGRFGIEVISDLAKMNLGYIKILLGKHGVDLWNVANGQDQSRVVPPTDAKSSSRSTTFPFDSSEPEFIESMLLYLTERVAKDLRSSSVFGKCISITVRTAEFVTTSTQLTIPHPVNTSLEIFRTASELLYKAWDGNTKLRLIGVSVLLASDKAHQAGLFEGNIEDKWSRIEVAMDRARAKHGFLSITRASILKMKSARPSDHRGFSLPNRPLRG